MIKLQYAPSTASMAPHIVLEEMGIPFELDQIDREGGELNSVAHRKFNPNGLIPVPAVRRVFERENLQQPWV